MTTSRKPPSAPVDPRTGIEAAQLAVYVHFPYCLSKCPYCDFASVAAREVPEARYAAAVVRELEQRVDTFGLRGRTVHSVFFGGGTPSLWDPRHVETVVQALTSTFQLAADAEVTLEANPGASDAERFRGFRHAGINRLSIGVQSFDPDILRALGRSHDAATAEAAFRAARHAGFANVSMDFIYGVHGQTLPQVEADARRAVSLEPEHLSAYALTLDRESLAEEVPLAKQLARGEVALPTDDTVVAMQRTVAEIYGAAGLARYEISNSARPGFHSRHNTAYWTGGAWLALGVGATGCVHTPTGAVRYANVRSAEKYLAVVERGEPAEASLEQLSNAELFAERVAMGLRLTSGIDFAGVCRDFGQDASARGLVVRQLVAGGLAEVNGDWLRLTPRGFDVHSAISARLM